MDRGRERHSLLQGVHMSAPAPDGTIVQAIMLGGLGDSLVGYLFARDAINEFKFQIREGSLESDAISAVSALRQTNHKDLFKLNSGRTR